MILNTFLRLGKRGTLGNCKGFVNILTEQKCYVSSGSFRLSSDLSASVESNTKSANMSKAMKAYLERTQAHDEFMKKQTSDFEIGKRHLANMMGEDPETFTQEDIDKAIQYLFPSGLFEPKARPMMKHPEEVFAKRKDAEFDETGRPFHPFFYTGLPNYYQVLHNITAKINELSNFQDRMIRYSVNMEEKTMDLGGTCWLTKEQFENSILEQVKDHHYEFFVKSMERLVSHPNSSRVKEFVMPYRRKMVTQGTDDEIPKLMYTEEGIPYMTHDGRRKSAKAKVTVYGQGSGKITINGQGILYFDNIQDREQVLFPLQFSKLLGSVDVVAEVEGGGPSGQSGAIRYGIAMCCRSFADREVCEDMRIAGLLMYDLRRRERQKPGQKGARAKFTWKKR